MQSDEGNTHSLRPTKFPVSLDILWPQSADWSEFWRRVRITSSSFRSNWASSWATRSAQHWPTEWTRCYERRWRKRSHKVRKHTRSPTLQDNVLISNNRAVCTLVTRWWWHCAIPLPTMLFSCPLSLASSLVSTHHTLLNMPGLDDSGLHIMSVNLQYFVMLCFVFPHLAFLNSVFILV